MPIYEYQCQKCGEIFEVFQRNGDKPATNCRHCSGEVKRIISPTGFILKGEGFYVNDYPSESRKKGVASEKKDTEPKTSKPSPAVKTESVKKEAESSAPA